MKKTNIMKNILKGASIGAIIASCGSASAVNHLAHNPSSTATAGDFTPGAFDATVVNNIYLNAAGSVLTIATHEVDLQTIDAVGYNGVIKFNDGANNANPLALLNSLVGSGGYTTAIGLGGTGSGATTDTAKFNILFEDETVGSIQSGSDHISTIDFANNGATLNIGTTGNDAGTLTLGALGIKSTGGANGALSFRGSGTILDTTTPAAGEGTAINEISVANAQTLTISSVALASSIVTKTGGDGIILHGAAALTLTGASGFVTTVGDVNPAAGATPTITIDQYSIITELDAVTNTPALVTVNATGGTITTLKTAAAETKLNVTGNALAINTITSPNDNGILTLNNDEAILVATTVGANGAAVATLACKGDGLFTSTGAAYVTTLTDSGAGGLKFGDASNITTLTHSGTATETFTGAATITDLNHSGTGTETFTGAATITTLTNTGTGALTFKGGGVIADLKINAVATTLNVDTTDLAITAITSAGNDGVLTLNNTTDVTAGTTGANAAVVATLNCKGDGLFTSTGAAYVTTLTDSGAGGVAFGNTAAITTLNHSGTGGVKFTGEAHITTLTNTGSGALTFKGDGVIAALNPGASNTTSIAVDTNPLTITKLAPTTTNTGTVTLNNTQLTTITTLGETAARLDSLTLNGSANVNATNDAYVNTVTNASTAGTFDFKAESTITTYNHTGAGISEFSDTSKITTYNHAATGAGASTFKGAATIGTLTNSSTGTGALGFGAAATITTYNHTGTSATTVTGAATIETMTYSGSGTLTFGAGSKVTTLNYTSATALDVGANCETTNIVFGPDATSLTSTSTTVKPTKVEFATNSSGSMVNVLKMENLTSGYTAATDTTITFDSSLPIAGKLSDGYISAPGVGTTYDGVTFTTSNVVTVMTGVKSDANTLYFMPTYNTDTLNAKLAAAGAKGNAANFINKLAGSNPAAGTTARALLNLISQQAGTNIEKSTEATDKVITSNFGSAASQAATDSSTSVVMSRFAVASAAEGVSSGDSESLSVVSSGAEDKMNIGVWGQILGATATQKSRKSDPGYKQKGAGVTLGVDTEISDYSVVGLSASYLGSNISFKDFMSGDKTKSTNLVMSLYGKTDLPYSTFVRAIATFGSGMVKSSSKRVATATTYDTAHANYNTMSYSIEALYGYKYGMSKDVSLVPAVGLRFVEMLDGGYTESGSRFNRTVSKKSSNSLTAVFGMGTEYKTHFDEYTLVTEAHIYGNYVASAKNPKISASFDGMNSTFDISPSKASKFSTNLGVSGTMKVCHYEYGLTYDAKISDKFVSHQGTLKLKVNL